MAAFVILDLFERANRRNFRRERLFRDRLNPIEKYDDIELYSKFRMDRRGLNQLATELMPYIRLTQRKGSLPPLHQLLIGLRYLATPAFQDTSAEVIDVSQPTASRCITRVVNAIIQNGRGSIRLPTEREANAQKVLFFEKAGIPEVIGCIDCTHVEILGPSVNGHEYINRKNFHSINVQMICDAQLKIINCVAKWPGSVHDARILRESALFRDFESENKPLEGIILGDSAYMMRTWLMTPYPNPANRREEGFNEAHARTRVKVENLFGVVKRRWGCLAHLRVKPEKVCRIIYACAILHNRLNTLRLPLPEEGRYDHRDQPPCFRGTVPDNPTERVRVLAGQGVRDRITRENF